MTAIYDEILEPRCDTLKAIYKLVAIECIDCITDLLKYIITINYCLGTNISS